MVSSKDEPSTKRMKLESNNEEILSTWYTNKSKSINELKSFYTNAKPYNHGMIDNFCNVSFLENVLKELKQNSKVKFKESDLFRVYQSVDLGNVTQESELSIQMPHLYKLKEMLYSSTFKNFVEDITSLPHGTLTSNIDCAVNCHTEGCHLLCHDDVIGNRKISFILYLTEEDWTEEYGGALELYDNIQDGDVPVPDVYPSKCILPLFNRFAYFIVEPGVSFHSVQEVFVDKPRLSIQGWYHCKETPKQMEYATLNRLKSNDPENIPFHSIQSNTTLTKEEITHLQNYINPIYFNTNTIQEIIDKFQEESSIQLCHFLTKDWNDKLATCLQEQDCKLGNGAPALKYDIGTDDGWVVRGPPHKQRYLECTKSKENTIGTMLYEIKTLFQSIPFSKFLNSITTIQPISHRGQIRRFRPGLDYTVAHYGNMLQEGEGSMLDATLCFANLGIDDDTKDEAVTSSIWESGDVGGFECYISAEEEDKEADDTYQEEDEDTNELLSVAVKNNTLSLVFRDPGTMKFVKYVGCHAPGSRWDIAFEFQIEEDEGEEGET